MGPRIGKLVDCYECFAFLEYQNQYNHTTPAHVRVPISRNLKGFSVMFTISFSCRIEIDAFTHLPPRMSIDVMIFLRSPRQFLESFPRQLQ